MSTPYFLRRGRERAELRRKLDATQISTAYLLRRGIYGAGRFERSEGASAHTNRSERVYIKDFVNAKVASISVATNYGYTSKDGSAVIETTWHYVTAWEGKDIQNLDQLKKGSGIHIIGRLRNRKYVAADGTERIAYEIVADKVEIIERP